MITKNLLSFLLIITAFSNGCDATPLNDDKKILFSNKSISPILPDWETAQNVFNKFNELKVEYGEFKNENSNFNEQKKTEHEKEFIKKLVEIFDMASIQKLHNSLRKIEQMEKVFEFAENYYVKQFDIHNYMLNHNVDEQKRAEHVEMAGKCRKEYRKMEDIKKWLKSMQIRFYTPGETLEKAIKEELIPRLAIGQKKKTTLLKIFENTGINDNADEKTLTGELTKLLGKFSDDKEILKEKILNQIGQCKSQFWKQILENMLDESSPFSKYATKAAESEGAIGAGADDKKENDEASSSVAAPESGHHKKHH